MDAFRISLLAAVSLTGLLCGASLDQSIKQLPARHRTGMLTFSAYAKAADLKNGVPWYAVLGIGSALAALLTAFFAWKETLRSGISFPVYAAAVFAIGQLICTSQAAPTYFKQKTLHDEESLRELFRKFERIQAIRSVFIVLSFAGYLWALASILKNAE